MGETDKTMHDLDNLFAAARETPAPVPDHLTSAILADAVAARIERITPEPKELARPRSGLWRQLMLAIGGLPAIGGLATACAAGVWIGLAPPSFLPDPAQLIGFSESTTVPYDSYDLAVVLGEEVQ